MSIQQKVAVVGKDRKTYPNDTTIEGYKDCCASKVREDLPFLIGVTLWACGNVKTFRYPTIRGVEIKSMACVGLSLRNSVYNERTYTDGD